MIVCAVAAHVLRLACAVQDAHAAAVERLRVEHQASEDSSAAEHATALAAKQAEVEELVAKAARLQAIVDESAAAHKAHAELKELRIKSKCDSDPTSPPPALCVTCLSAVASAMHFAQRLP
jgi:hypothetical protein